MNYQEEFEKMIEEYNSGSRNIDTLFQQLISFTQTLDVEEQRHLSEQLSEEELAIFDLLIKTRPSPDYKKKGLRSKRLPGIAREIEARETRFGLAQETKVPGGGAANRSRLAEQSTARVHA